MEEAPQQDQNNKTTTTWTATQTYVMATVCLLIGALVGYLIRGSANPAGQAAPVAGMQQSASTPPPGMGQQRMPTLDDLKRMADKQAEPLTAKLKTDPKNVELLYKTGLTYKAAHQFKDAIAYFQKALEIEPGNVPIRTEMASCMYYSGDVDGALAELNKSLSYDPKHAGTLMNIGIIKWKGKNDVNGAIAAWQTLLKLNPDFPQKAVIEHLITQAQQQSSANAPVPGKG